MNEYQPPPQEPMPYPGGYHGYQPPMYGPPTTYGYKNGIATAGMVLAIVGVSLSWMPVVGIVSFILTALAIIFGAIGLRKIKRGTSDAKGRAHTALWLGVAGFAVTALFGVIYAMAINDASNDYDKWDRCTDSHRVSEWDTFCDQYLD